MKQNEAKKSGTPFGPRKWFFVSKGEVRAKETELRKKGISRKTIIAECGFSKSTYDRLIKISDHKDLTREISLDRDVFSIWLGVVIRLGVGDGVSEKSIQYADGFQPTMDLRPQVTFIQRFSGRDSQDILGTAFYREAILNGWRSDYLPCSDHPESVANAIKSASLDGHLIVDLPDVLAIDAIEKNVSLNRIVISTGWVELPEAVLRVQFSADSYASAISAGLADEAEPSDRLLVFLSDEHTSQTHFKALGRRIDSLEKTVINPTDSIAQEVEKLVAILGPMMALEERVALITIEEERTQAMLLALERLEWPPTLLLYSSHMASSWLRIFDCRPTWRLSVLIDFNFLVEVCCGILRAKISDPVNFPKSFQSCKLERTVLTQSNRKKVNAAALIELIAILSKGNRSQFKEEYPWIGLR